MSRWNVLRMSFFFSSVLFSRAILLSILERITSISLVEEQFSSHLVPGGAPSRSLALNFIRSGLLVISIRAVNIGLIYDKIPSVASSEAQQALADYVRLFGRGRSPWAQLLFSDGWVLLYLLVSFMQRKDHLINEARLGCPSVRHNPGRVVLADDRTTGLRDTDLGELLARGLLVLTAE